MVKKIDYDVLPGGLTDADRDRILDLAEEGVGYARIAKAISKHPSTVEWFLYRHGLKSQQKGKQRAPYLRKGILVRPFTPEEDVFIAEQRLDGKSTYAIAELIEGRFGYSRKPHAVEVRLVMLAGFEEAEAARAA